MSAAATHTHVHVEAGDLNALLGSLAQRHANLEHEVADLGDAPPGVSSVFQVRVPGVGGNPTSCVQMRALSQYCRVFERAFIAAVNSKDTAPLIRSSFAGDSGLKARSRAQCLSVWPRTRRPSLPPGQARSAPDRPDV